MKQRFLALGTLTMAISCALVLVPVAANATEQPQPLLTVAREMPTWVNQTTPSWPQPLYGFHENGDLNGFDAELAALPVPCGQTRQFQIDVNYDTSVIRGTVAGKRLNGPNDPGESLIPGGWGVAYKLVLVKGPECTPEPPLTPFSDAGETFTCEAWLLWTKTGHFEHTFDAVANVWTDAAEPTIDAETSEMVPTTVEERYSRGCVTPTPEPTPPATAPPAPELAETGLSTAESWWLVGGIAATLAGLGALLYARSRNRKYDE